MNSRSAAVGNAKAKRLGSVRDSYDIDLVVKDIGRKITPLYGVMDPWSIVIASFLVAAGVLRCTARIVIHITLTYLRMGGCGCWLPIAACESLQGARFLAWELLATVTNKAFLVPRRSPSYADPKSELGKDGARSARTRAR